MKTKKPKWCDHIIWEDWIRNYGETPFWDTTITKFEVTKATKYCPRCGKPRPKGKSENSACIVTG